MSDEAAVNAIEPAIVEIVQLFKEHMPAVRFGETDHTTLETMVHEVISKAGDVERLKVDLAEARAALEGAHQSLCKAALRALAYARIYAEDDEELAAHLSNLALCQDGDTRSSRRSSVTGRRRRGDAVSGSPGSDGARDLAVMAELPLGALRQ